MSANRRRGEIVAELDGKGFRLCLTLGALAELEAAYAAEDLHGAGRAVLDAESCRRPT